MVRPGVSSRGREEERLGGSAPGEVIMAPELESSPSTLASGQ